MRIAFVSKFKTKNIEGIIKKFGFEIVRKNPDFVLCYGGDGTILLSERIYPGIPKIIIKRESVICRKCDYTEKYLEAILSRIVKDNYKTVNYYKLIAKSRGRELIGLNEIQIHNKVPIRAVRFYLKINGKKIESLMGDGVIFATPFGSTAYYSSTGGNPFKKGIGVSFNNLHLTKMKSFVVKENSKIEVGIKRGPALVIADNYGKYIEVGTGDRISIEKTNKMARFVFI